ncbi:hypothetical protein FB563_1331 [Streptomyces puniciscabiei]|uniref:Uncharacterized protein n=2 Tax=Streptomyces puniciscabiei TaxID=164348 RepID=A0A542UBG0_9ACTN|nr:hypothetical protein FB563_1331 [Streptomyces puniciscabiei]
MNNCYYNCSPKFHTGPIRGIQEGGSDPMLFLVAALMLLGVVLGTVAHAPLTITAAVAAGIAVWLAVFAIRERLGRRRRTSAN